MKFANATNLNRKSGGAKPSGSAVRHSCAPLLPAHNASNLNRKSGGAKPTCPGVPWRDLRFRGPFLETRNDNGEVGVFMRIRWRLVKFVGR